MKRFILLLISFLSLLQYATAATKSGLFHLTMAGTRQTVTQWLSENGYNYIVLLGSNGLVQIRNIEDPGELLVELIPHTPLATEVEIHLNQGEEEPEKYVHLFASLRDKSITEKNTASNWKPAKTPEQIQQHIGSTVCIHSAGQNDQIQLSGVFINSKGLILSTAHDLEVNDRLNIISSNGTTFQGHVIKIDFQRDLALIQSGDGKAKQKPQNISLERGRNLLNMNEMVFSIGCPLNLRGTVTAGIINGLPRRVNDLPMWQIAMKIDPGSSGSPVFDNNGDFVALIKGRHRTSNGITYLTPLEVIIDFLNEQLTQ